MTSPLHEFDVALCHYVRNNLSQIGDAESREELRGDLDDRLLAWFADDEIDASEPDTELLLGWGELFDLEEASRLFPGRLEWASYPPLHQRYVQTIAEVREGLTRETAEQWARICIECGQRLELEGLPLDLGIEVIREWTYDLRQLLRAMGREDLLPAPEGGWPTPTHPDPQPASTQASVTGLHAEGRDKGGEAEAVEQPKPPEGVPMLVGLENEYSLREAADVLGCDKKTVIKLIEEKVLEWRNAAPPSSTRPIYRIAGHSLLDFRTTYKRGTPQHAGGPSRRRRQHRTSAEMPRHIKLDDRP